MNKFLLIVLIASLFYVIEAQRRPGGHHGRPGFPRPTDPNGNFVRPTDANGNLLRPTRRPRPTDSNGNFVRPSHRPHSRPTSVTTTPVVINLTTPPILVTFPFGK